MVAMKLRMDLGWMVVACALGCGDSGGGETGDGTNQTSTGVQTTGGATTTAPGTTGTPTTGDDLTTGSGGATTTSADPTTGDPTTGTTATDPATGSSSTADDTTVGSTSTGMAATCGDGVVDAGEECDDAGESKACDADCSAAQCGDGHVNDAAGEVCDEAGESLSCDADCSLSQCGDGVINMVAGESCEGETDVINAECNGDCIVQCSGTFLDCNADSGDGCEVETASDSKHCGDCGNVCPNGETCKASKCVAPIQSFHSYPSEGRTVHLFKSGKCAALDQQVNFCQDLGLTWWKAKTQADAQKLIDEAFALDQHHTWIQVFGAVTNTQASTVDGFQVVVDQAGCVDSSPDGWTAFRKWACSFCEPSNNQNESCCWDKDHAYDWFVCEE
jgi:hypothetical protein